MAATTRGLAFGFFASADRWPDRPALDLSGETLTYAIAYQRVASIASTLLEHAPSNDPPLTAILAHRSWTAYLGILAILGRGHGYVPLTPTVPASRNHEILKRVGCEALIVDSSGLSQLDGVLADQPKPLVVFLPDRADVSMFAERWPAHRFVPQTDFNDGREFTPRPPDEQDVAYLLFTSGSTGLPKGVMVSHANIRHFLDTVASWYSIEPSDRLTQLFELVFDLSLFDLFAAWDAGACVCSPSLSEMLLPAQFVASAEPTIWFSVPSTAWLMEQQRALTAGAFPSLRLSLFCGEALPAAIARAWASAAPNSTIENLYGPTELTVSCTRYIWRGNESDQECENGIVPIGDPFPRMEALIANENNQEVGPGAEGELLMTGPQVSLGYYRSREQTQSAFVHVPGRSEVFYRTGDRVRKPLPGQPMQYIGRVDHQIKIRGHRVELGEVEAAVREASGIQGVAAVGWPKTPGGASGIVAFIHAEQLDVPQLRRQLRERLPRHMVPNEIELVSTLPLTTSGKVDRNRLIHHYAHRTSKGPHERTIQPQIQENSPHVAHS